MSGGLRVSPEQLGVLAGAVARQSAEVRAAHEALRRQLIPLFGNDWSGAAANQFTALYGNFDRHATGLSDALDGIGLLLDRAGATYASAEAHIAASFR
jgi:WXG100 family type VII secretion target